LNRQVIKSDSASLFIPSLDFEIPPGTQRGTISTLEGVLERAADNLEELQPERLRLGDVDNFHRCRKVIERLRVLAGQQDCDPEAASPFPFVIILDDLAGNSFVENPHAPKTDPNVQSTKYDRTPTQDMALGLQPSKEAVEAGKIDDANPTHKNITNAPSHNVSMEKKNENDASFVHQEVMKFPTTCSHCHESAETDMCIIDIPHFKEVIVMSLLCEKCGYKSNEIKGGGAIPKFGTKITLRVSTADDLAREVLKSDTAGLEIPELELELDEGGLDGVYTTVEGLLNKLYDRLESANPFGSGDAATKQHLENDGGSFSAPSTNTMRYMAFLMKLKDMGDGKTFPFTIIISDPLSNSFLGPVPADAIALSRQAEKDGNNRCYEAYVDKGMDIEEYERTHDQNEVLGLNDMKTENYQVDADDNAKTYYGTDNLQELPDRLRRLDVRGPDHPHAVGMAPVEGDITVMGAASMNFAVPGMAQRGKVAAAPLAESSDLHAILHKFEKNDGEFRMTDEYQGGIKGMVFKDGAQGLGYYTDMPLHELWERQHQ
jgi:zinc finger protein